MKLNKYKLGDLIKQSFKKNSDEIYSVESVRGISTGKEFIKTKADMNGISTKNYLLVKPGYFAYVSDTSRRGDKISLSYNMTIDTYIVSSISTCFYVERTDILDPKYLFMYFNRPEFDRYTRFNSWGSARETFDWSEMCNINIELPPLEVQKKYVAIYNAMMENQKTYETGLDDLKLVFESTIEKLRKEYKCEEIGPYIEQSSLRNTDLKYNLNDVMGISQNKKFVKTVADGSGNDISKYYIVKKDNFAYSPRNGTAVALNNECKEFIISFNNTCFCIKEKAKNILLPEYLFLFFLRDEWSRKAAFDSWGSTVPLYQFDRLKTTTIPIPPLDVQQSIVSILNAWQKRIKINEKIKTINKTLCPILIKGSLEKS